MPRPASCRTGPSRPPESCRVSSPNRPRDRALVRVPDRPTSRPHRWHRRIRDRRVTTTSTSGVRTRARLRVRFPTARLRASRGAKRPAERVVTTRVEVAPASGWVSRRVVCAGIRPVVRPEVHRLVSSRVNRRVVCVARETRPRRVALPLVLEVTTPVVVRLPARIAGRVRRLVQQVRSRRRRSPPDRPEGRLVATCRRPSPSV